MEVNVDSLQVVPTFYLEFRKEILEKSLIINTSLCGEKGYTMTFSRFGKAKK